MIIKRRCKYVDVIIGNTKNTRGLLFYISYFFIYYK